jgi:hypothetical protein
VIQPPRESAMPEPPRLFAAKARNHQQKLRCRLQAVKSAQPAQDHLGIWSKMHYVHFLSDSLTALRRLIRGGLAQCRVQAHACAPRLAPAQTPRDFELCRVALAPRRQACRVPPAAGHAASPFMAALRLSPAGRPFVSRSGSEGG